MISKLFVALVTISLSFQSASALADWNKSTVELQSKPAITVYRDPNCQCCHRWIEHLERHGFVVKDIKSGNMGAIKQKTGVARNVASCHTAIVDGYFIEGHVPADDIKQLLVSRPDIKGLSVPAMPVGTPGMEIGKRKDPFNVIQVNPDGSLEIYRKYIDY